MDEIKKKGLSSDVTIIESVIGHYWSLFSVSVLITSGRCNLYFTKCTNNVISCDYNIINCYFNSHNY